MGDLLDISGNGGAGQDKLPKFAAVIHLKADCVPQLGGQLPFVDEPGSRAFQQALGVQLRHGNVLFLLFRVIHIQDTGRQLFGGRGLTAPFWPFDQNRAFALQLPLQNIIGDPLSIGFHSEHLVSTHAAYRIRYYDKLYNSFPTIGKIIFR